MKNVFSYASLHDYSKCILVSEQKRKVGVCTVYLGLQVVNKYDDNQ